MTNQLRADQETLVEQLQTYIYGLQQQLEEMRVDTTDDVKTLRRAQVLVDDAPLKKKMDAAAQRLSAKGRKVKAQVQRSIQTLRRAIEIIEENSTLVRPNQFRARCAILEVMGTSSRPVSSKQIIEYLSLCGLLMDRRRLSIRLSYMKRDGVVKNPKHGRWAITAAGRKELAARQQ